MATISATNAKLVAGRNRCAATEVDNTFDIVGLRLAAGMAIRPTNL